MQLSLGLGLVLTFFVIPYLQPEKVKLELRLGQSKPLYNAFKAIQESSDWPKLNEARKRIVESEYLISQFSLILDYASSVSI